MKVAYQGARGAYSEAALRRQFGPRAQALGYALSEQVFEAVAEGRVRVRGEGRPDRRLLHGRGRAEDRHANRPVVLDQAPEAPATIDDATLVETTELSVVDVPLYLHSYAL